MIVNAVAFQPRIWLPYPTPDTFDPDAIGANIAASATHIEMAVSELGADFVAFPEFFLTGYTLGIDVAGWRKASIKIPGPETDILCKAAIKNNVHVAITAYEVIDEFPDRFFNTAIVIDPNGEIVLTYRKHYAMTTKTRPVDILDQWLDLFGEDSLFPVADTKIGRIGAMIARDSHWPEMARCLALKGAEILYNPIAMGSEPDDGGQYIRNCRAYENLCYLIAPNIGPFQGADGEERDDGIGRAPSKIIDYRGNVMNSQSGSKESMVLAKLDMDELRKARMKGNFVAQLQPQLHAPIYAGANLFPSNGWADNPIVDNSENDDREADVVRQMLADDILVPPS